MAPDPSSVGATLAAAPLAVHLLPPIGGSDRTLVGEELLIDLIAGGAVALRRIGLVVGPLLLLAARLCRHRGRYGYCNRQSNECRNDPLHDLSDRVCQRTRLASTRAVYSQSERARKSRRCPDFRAITAAAYPA